MMYRKYTGILKEIYDVQEIHKNSKGNMMYRKYTGILKKIYDGQEIHKNSKGNK